MVDDGRASVPGPPYVIGQRWAKKVDVSDGERVRAAQQGQQLTSRFTVLSDSLTRAVDGGCTIECEGATYQVTGTKDVGDRRHDAIEITTSSTPDRTA